MASVTVVVPTYNSGNFIDATLGCILAQTLTDIDVVVIDDGSTNDVVERVRRIADPRLRVIVNERNIGVAATRNRGLALAETEFIAHCDHDDRWEPEKLARQVAFLRDHANLGAVSTEVGYLRADGTKAMGPAFSARYEGRLCTAAHYRWLVYFTSPFLHSSLMLRMQVVREHKLRYDEALSLADDWDFYFRLMAVTDCQPVPGVLAYHHQHGENWSIRGRDKMFANTRFMFARLGEALGREVKPDEGWAFYSAVTLGEPCESREALDAIGSMIADITNRFFQIHKLSADEVSLIRHRAAERWWRVVRQSAVTGHPAFLARYFAREMPGWVRPPWVEVATGAGRAGLRWIAGH